MNCLVCMVAGAGWMLLAVGVTVGVVGVRAVTNRRRG